MNLLYVVICFHFRSNAQMSFTQKLSLTLEVAGTMWSCFLNRTNSHFWLANQTQACLWKVEKASWFFFPFSRFSNNLNMMTSAQFVIYLTYLFLGKMGELCFCDCSLNYFKCLFTSHVIALDIYVFCIYSYFALVSFQLRWRIWNSPHLFVKKAVLYQLKLG